MSHLYERKSESEWQAISLIDPFHTNALDTTTKAFKPGLENAVFAVLPTN